MDITQEINEALDVLSSAKNRWDYEEKQGPLWDVANKHPVALMELFEKYPDHQFSIAWCLAHVESDQTKDFFITLADSKDSYLRWCAYLRLKNYSSEDMVDLFAKGIRDRSSLVKGEALEAVKGLRDDRITAALNHIVSLKSFKKNSPGYFEDAQRLLREME